MTTPEWKLKLVEFGGSTILTLLGATLRFDVEGDEVLHGFRERGEPVILAFWHAQILPLAHLHRRQGIVVLVSQHRDGEYIARVIRRRGFGTVRGSSTRGGAAGLKGLVRAAREGKDLGITPDGPKGPARKVKHGTLVAAQLAGIPIIPMAGGGRRVWRLGSWDRFLVPKPFARIRVRYGPPLFVPRNADADTLSALAGRLEGELDRLTDAVDGRRESR